MKIIRKDASIEPVGPDDEFPGRFRVILSAPTLDRDGDTLLPDEWKQPLPDHITFDTDHGMSVASTVGSGVPSIDSDTGNLIVDGTYSSIPRAQEVRTLVNEGHIKTTSVAFMTVRSAAKGAAKNERELLNGAFVAIPSNREALVLDSKAATEKVGARNSGADLEQIQAIHDAASSLGADCAGMEKRAHHAETKSIVGSLEAMRDRVNDALTDLYNAYPYVVGTLPDGNGGGTVVFELWGENIAPDDEGPYQQAYEDDGSVVTLVGERTPVDVMQVVSPDVDAVKSLVWRKDADTEDASDPVALIRATDAAIDQAIDLLADVDPESLPAEAQQAIALIQAADAAVDELMDALGIPDPDEDAEPVDEPGPAAAEKSPAAAPASKAADADSAVTVDDVALKAAAILSASFI